MNNKATSAKTFGISINFILYVKGPNECIWNPG